MMPIDTQSRLVLKQSNETNDPSNKWDMDISTTATAVSDEKFVLACLNHEVCALRPHDWIEAVNVDAHRHGIELWESSLSLFPSQDQTVAVAAAIFIAVKTPARLLELPVKPSAQIWLALFLQRLAHGQNPWPDDLSRLCCGVTGAELQAVLDSMEKPLDRT